MVVQYVRKLFSTWLQLFSDPQGVICSVDQAALKPAALPRSLCTSGLPPIFDCQGRNPREVGGVSCDEDSSMLQCGGSDDQVCVAARMAILIRERPEFGRTIENGISDR